MFAEVERTILEPIPVLLSEHWCITVNRSDWRLLDIQERHYNYRPRKSKRTQGVAPGKYIALLTEKRDAAFVWSKEAWRKDGQTGINCAIFRNESKVLSSTLIAEACEIAWRKWPNERLFTFVDGTKVKSANPGYCFIKAGWQRCGKTQGGLLVFEIMPNG